MPRAAMELMKENEDLLSVCLTLHGDNTGIADPMPEEERLRMKEVLWHAMGNWIHFDNKSQRFDDAVLRLVEITWVETLQEDIKRRKYSAPYLEK